MGSPPDERSFLNEHRTAIICAVITALIAGAASVIAAKVNAESSSASPSAPTSAPFSDLPSPQATTGEGSSTGEAGKSPASVETSPATAALGVRHQSVTSASGGRRRQHQS